MADWGHQQRAREQLRTGFRQGHRRGCLVIPTGGGKTRTSLEMARQAIDRGNRCLFVADRRVLVSQAARAAHDLGIPCGILMSDAGRDWYDPQAPLQVASKDSLVSWLKRPNFELPEAKLIVVDECHKSVAVTWDVIRKRYPDAYEVGLSATPCLSDGRGLGTRYEFLVQPTSYADLIAQGVLIQPECYSVGSRIEGKKSQKPTTATMVGDAVYWWQKFANGLSTFIFASGVPHSLALRDQFREAGVRAEHIDAHTPDVDRDRILRELASGEITVVCNCAVLRYGVDVPSVECCQIVAPMGSIIDYRQSVGRVLRSSDGKRRAVVIDHAGAVLYHGFPHADLPWTLDGETKHDELQRQRMATGEAPVPIACPTCFTLFSGARKCPSCGWEPKRQAKSVGTKAGTLQRVAEDVKAGRATQVDLQRAWASALAMAVHRGLSCSVAAKAFERTTGSLPWHCDVRPLPEGSDWKRPAAEVFPDWVRRKNPVRD